MTLPISMDLIQKRKETPQKIAELSYLDEKRAIHYLRMWGANETPITTLHESVSREVKKHETLRNGRV